MDFLSVEERAAASAVASLASGKREREDDSPDAAGGVHKRGRTEAPEEPAALVAAAAAGPPAPQVAPYPFFLYKDHSALADPDPLAPLTPPGRVPNFPAKMHSILSRPDLADVVCWMSHGRSWRVLKPREFEVRVIPTYFEHAKFSSFIRQANGWGFRRITQGRDRNSYYHELFLRGLPHLCKKMKRPGVAQKPAADPDHEPDFYKISEMHPVPEKAEDDSILLQCTLQGGPKARMPIYSGVLSSLSKTESTFTGLDTKMPPLAASLSSTTSSSLTPSDNESISSFQKALGASENQLKNLDLQSPTPEKKAAVALPASTFAAAAQPPTSLPFFPVTPGASKVSPLAAANQLAFCNPNMAAAALQATTAATQFAAGFAAAAAISQQQFKSMLDSFAAQQNWQPPIQTNLSTAADAKAPPTSAASSPSSS